MYLCIADNGTLMNESIGDKPTISVKQQAPSDKWLAGTDVNSAVIRYTYKRCQRWCYEHMYTHILVCKYVGMVFVPCLAGQLTVN